MIICILKANRTIIYLILKHEMLWKWSHHTAGKSSCSNRSQATYCKGLLWK